jgi:ketosteroid isomerase-like protein
MDDAGFISFAESLDRCWMQGRLQDLKAFLAEDVVFVAPGGTPRSEGIAPAIESYRQFLSHAQVNSFETSNHVVTQRGDTAIVEYEWQMAWLAGGEEHQESGREVLVLAGGGEDWRVVWRTQIPKGAQAK